MIVQDQIRQLFSQLSPEEQKSLVLSLSETKGQNTDLHFIGHIKQCPHCTSADIIKHSHYRGTQRFKCKACKRTFIPTTGGPSYHIKKQAKFSAYAKIIKEEGLLTIATMSKRLGISIPTAFDWRHKILLSVPKKKERFVGETQMDDFWFLYSQKGRKGLKFARKRGGTSIKGDTTFQVKVLAASDKTVTEMKVARVGRISAKDVLQSMGDKFNKNTKLVTDAHRSYRAFSKMLNIEHVDFISTDHKAETGENTQYLNNLSGRLGTQLNRVMRGVSTKYLQLYVSYFAYLEYNKIELSGLAASHNTWDVFANIEKIYEKFIADKSVRTYRCATKRAYKSQNWNKANAFAYYFL